MATRASSRWTNFRGAVCALTGFIGIAPAAVAPGNSLQVLFSFDEDDGSYPDTDLVMDGAGNLYGMTVQGGAFNGGTVFQLSPSSSGWIHTTLHDFTGGADGGQPYGGVTLDALGNVYGTTVIGGSGGVCVEDGCGVVFQLVKTGSTWTENVIHDFSGSDGFGPGGPVTFDAAGNLYGMTPTGGDFGLGTVFRLAPQPSGPWTSTVIHHFTGGDDGGSASAGRLLDDASGSLFGVATTGGAFGLGVAFRIDPGAGGTWTLTPLHAFQGAPDGVFPYGGLVADAAGDLYGTTYYGGANDVGTVYKLSDDGGAWSARVLHDFAGGTDGASPISGLVFVNGNLYGTTAEGGAGCNCGTVFRMRPLPTGKWKTRVIHAFTGIPDGAYAYAGLIADAAGTLYGATVRGGADDDGTVFALRP
jgi:uncharacterized repeat protein (TIGR03803 family)